MKRVMCILFVHSGFKKIRCFNGSMRTCAVYSTMEKSLEYPGSYTKSACRNIAKKLGMVAEFVEK